MSAADRAIRGGASKSPDPDDWDHHWDAYGEAAEGNPANVYRRQLVMRLLGRPPAGATVLDIGSGQGEFAIHLRETYRMSRCGESSTVRPASNAAVPLPSRGESMSASPSLT